MKFGGTSVQDPEAVARVVQVVAGERRPRLVVVSALARVTDALLEVARLAERGDAAAAREAVRALRLRHEAMTALVRQPERRAELLKTLDALFAELEGVATALAVVREVSPRSCDALVAAGELASSRIVAAALAEGGLPSRWLDPRELLVTDAAHGAAAPDRAATDERLRARVSPLLQEGLVGGHWAGSWARPRAASPRRSAAAAPTTRPRSSARGSRPRRSRSGPTWTAC